MKTRRKTPPKLVKLDRQHIIREPDPTAYAHCIELTEDGAENTCYICEGWALKLGPVHTETVRGWDYPGSITTFHLEQVLGVNLNGNPVIGWRQVFVEEE